MMPWYDWAMSKTEIGGYNMPMLHVCSFSTGLSSALATERVINRYGPDSVVIAFMDTTIEDSDNYRFQRDVHARWIDMGVTNFVILKDGRTPFQAAEDQHVIPNQKIAPRTYLLKIRQFVRWLKKQEGPITVHIGYDFTEMHRTGRTRAKYRKYGWRVDFPLLWKPVESRPYPRVVQQEWGITPPRMYKLGYTHANCGGVCVKQGHGDWVRTLINFPERYDAIEKWEDKMRDHPQREGYAILRDQSKEQVRPKTLQQLREEYEARDRRQASLFGEPVLVADNEYLKNLDMASSCVRCGVGDLVIDETEELL